MTTFAHQHQMRNQEAQRPECAIVRRDEEIAKPVDAGTKSGRTQE